MALLGSPLMLMVNCSPGSIAPAGVETLTIALPAATARLGMRSVKETIVRKIRDLKYLKAFLFFIFHSSLDHYGHFKQYLFLNSIFMNCTELNSSLVVFNPCFSF